MLNTSTRKLFDHKLTTNFVYQQKSKPPRRFLRQTLVKRADLI